jgi:hypothetical protein
VQLLCNRYFALNTKKMITITKAFRPACSMLLLRKARFSAKWIRCGRETRSLFNLLRGLPRHAEVAQQTFKMAHNRALYFLPIRAGPVIPADLEWLLLGGKSNMLAREGAAHFVNTGIYTCESSAFLMLGRGNHLRYAKCHFIQVENTQ